MVAAFDVVLDDAAEEEVFGAVGEEVGVLDGGTLASVEGKRGFHLAGLFEEGHLGFEAGEGGEAGADAKAALLERGGDFGQRAGEGVVFDDGEHGLPLIGGQAGEEALGVAFQARFGEFGGHKVIGVEGFHFLLGVAEDLDYLQGVKG